MASSLKLWRATDGELYLIGTTNDCRVTINLEFNTRGSVVQRILDDLLMVRELRHKPEEHFTDPVEPVSGAEDNPAGLLARVQKARRPYSPVLDTVPRWLLDALADSEVSKKGKR